MAFKEVECYLGQRSGRLPPSELSAEEQEGVERVRGFLTDAYLKGNVYPLFPGASVARVVPGFEAIADFTELMQGEPLVGEGLVLRGEERIDLTQQEFVLLERLAKESGGVVPKREIKKAWLGGNGGSKHSDGHVRTVLKTLRAKIGPGRIERVKNQGWRLRNGVD